MEHEPLFMPDTAIRASNLGMYRTAGLRLKYDSYPHERGSCSPGLAGLPLDCDVCKATNTHATCSSMYEHQYMAHKDCYTFTIVFVKENKYLLASAVLTAQHLNNKIHDLQGWSIQTTWAVFK